MAFSRKRARKYAPRRSAGGRRMKYPRTTGIRAPLATRGYFPQKGFGGRRNGIRPELKKYDCADTSVALGGTPTTRPFTLSATNVVTNANVVTIFAPAQGTDFTQRLGRRVMVKTIQVQGFLRTEGATATTAMVRLVCVLDMQRNLTANNPAITDILGDSTGAFVQDFNNLDNRSRFKVIFDHKVYMQTGQLAAGTVLASGADSKAIVNMYKKVNFPVTFGTGISGISADIATGAITLFALSNSAAGTAYEWRLCTRVRFTDA